MNKGFIFLGLLLFLLSSCNPSHKTEKPASNLLVVALSKANYDKEGVSHYGLWLTANDSNIQWIDLYKLPLDSVPAVLQTCSGLVLTGGEDVNPVLHHKGDEINQCGVIDRHRDSLELMAINKAIQMKMPVMGICRGEQILNVSLGGSLFTDIPSDHPSPIYHRCQRADTCFHKIYLTKNSLLAGISSMDSATVNSAHHQAIDRLAPGLTVNAIAADSIIEAVSWKNPEGKNFLLAVQFHPERLDIKKGISHKMALRFIQEMKKYKNSSK